MGIQNSTRIFRRRVIVGMAFTAALGVASWIDRPAAADPAFCEVLAHQDRTLAVYREFAAEASESARPFILDRIGQLQSERESTQRLLGGASCP